MALFTIAKIDNVRGIFRSDDAGATWVRINDDQHQWGNIGAAITGDSRTYGRVYVGTNGRGIQYGDRLGSPPTTTSSTTTSTTRPSSSTSTTTSTTRPPTTTGPASTTTTTAPAGSCQVSYTIQSQWQNGFTADVTIRNTGTTAVSGWALAWTFGGNQQITNMWNAVPTQTGQAVSARDAGWNTMIVAGGSAGFGFQASFSGSNAKPTAFRLNGTTCGVA